MKTFKYLKCHPNHTSTESCIDHKSLIKMKNIWNKRHPDKKINSVNIENKLRNYLSICKDQSCLIDHTLGKNKLKSIIFAPYSPVSWNSDKSMWLDSLDIMKVMKQYEDTYPNFKFIGPSPIDFDTTRGLRCVWPELCNISMSDELKNGKTVIGIIFNTDPHYKVGSHWICMFIDLKTKYIFNFDSSGYKIPPEINSFIDKIDKQCINENLVMTRYNNVNVKHQYAQGECGMYCLYTIVKLLENKLDPNSFIKSKIKDSTIIKYRTIFFNPTYK